jgi:hypothetical protein
MIDFNDKDFTFSEEYHKYFQRKVHNIVKLTSMLANMFPWADIDKSKKALEMYNELKYNIESDFKKENNIEDKEDNYVYFSDKKIKDALKQAITEWDQETIEALQKENKCSVTYTVNVQEDEHGPLIELPPEIIEELGWKENDIVTWHIKEDGSVTIEKEVYNEVEDDQG